MITVHSRLRVHSYAHAATWEWIAEAATVIARGSRHVPLVGNGGIDGRDDVVRMLASCGCDAVMIGRAALADPWIFAQALGADTPDGAQAAEFAIRYADRLVAEYGPATAFARLKQLTRWYRAGDLFAGDDQQRQRLLRVSTLDELRAWYVVRACARLTM